MKKLIRNFIYEVGIPIHLKGYRYLCKSVELVVEDNNRLFNLHKDVFDQVARECKTTTKRVEKDVRNAIAVGYKRHGKDEKYKIFYDKDNLGNKEYIAKLVHLITK